jgi:hypothetical protein
MRTMALAVLVSTPMLAAAPAHAQTYDPSYPVCLNRGGGEYYECHYNTLAQCNASASGRNATCLTNPFFAQASGRPSQRRQRPY